MIKLTKEGRYITAREYHNKEYLELQNKYGFKFEFPSPDYMFGYVMKGNYRIEIDNYGRVAYWKEDNNGNPYHFYCKICAKLFIWRLLRKGFLVYDD